MSRECRLPFVATISGNKENGPFIAPTQESPTNDPRWRKDREFT